MSTAEANRLFYSEYAEQYDRTECCMVDAAQRHRLDAALDSVLALLPAGPAVLDACGGSGNVGVSLARHRLVPVVVDVSQEMTQIWRQKAQHAGVAPEIHVETIEAFLASDPRSWDLVTFCSGLHHLDDPARVLAAAAARLAPGGLILTIFDPTPGNGVLRLARRGDWLLELLLRDPLGFLRLGRAKLRRRAQGENPQESVGRLAERHAYAGIDDHALVEELRALGLEIVVHERYVDARMAPVRWLLHALGRPSHFRLLVRAPGSRR
jgi:SAM-dependent methyltransferase